MRGGLASRRGLWALVAALMLAGPAQAADQELRLCMAESSQLPAWMWRSAGLAEEVPSQLDVFTAALLGREARVRVLARVLPWRRCLLEVQMGRLDGVLGLSHTPERAQWAVFPLRAGAPDESLRLRRDAYHWYVAARSKLRWDGEALRGLPAPRLASVAGYSVVERLQGQGYAVETQTSSVGASLRMLALGRIDAAALLQGEAEPWLAREPQLAQGLRRLEPPLMQRSYFLAFSQAYAQQDVQRLQRVWSALASVRESELQRRAEQAAAGG